MFNSENQDMPGQGFNSGEGLGGNLVQEGNMNEGEQGQNQFDQDPNYMEQNQNPQTINSDHSLHIDKKFDDFTKSKKFMENENKLNQKMNTFLDEKVKIPANKLLGYLFFTNKILLLTTFTEFIFQRFDVVTLFLCIVVILIELEIFSRKHLYKWLAVLMFSFLLDALVLIDIAPVSILLF